MLQCERHHSKETFIQAETKAYHCECPEEIVINICLFKNINIYLKIDVLFWLGKGQMLSSNFAFFSHACVVYILKRILLILGP